MLHLRLKKKKGEKLRPVASETFIRWDLSQYKGDTAGTYYLGPII